eukprot:5863437-Amphidinium_carterae.2
MSGCSESCSQHCHGSLIKLLVLFLETPLSRGHGVGLWLQSNEVPMSKLQSKLLTKLTKEQAKPAKPAKPDYS